MTPRNCLRLAGALAAMLLLAASPVRAESLRLAVQPVLSPDDTTQSFAPLARYLSQATGHSIQLVTANDFLSYWTTMKRGQYDLVLDGPHFTDYRVQRMGYRLVAKVRDVVSYSLVTSERNPVLDPSDLVAKAIATSPAPSYGGLVLLRQLFPNPARQPRVVDASSTREAINHVLEGRADAAFVPTPFVAQTAGLYTVYTTPQHPHIALSAAPTVPQAVVEKLRQALLTAESGKDGRDMLTLARIPGFEPATPEQYRGFLSLLSETWGF